MTIYALSTGPGIGMAVITSGEKANKVITKLTKGKLPSPRVAKY